MLALQPVALLVLLLVPGFVDVVAFVTLFGAAKGRLTLVRLAFVAELYGRAKDASIAGALAFAVTLAQAGAPVGAGAAYDALGGYAPILWALVVVSGVASVCLLPARRGSSSPGSTDGAVEAMARSTTVGELLELGAFGRACTQPSGLSSRSPARCWAGAALQCSRAWPGERLSLCMVWGVEDLHLTRQ